MVPAAAAAAANSIKGLLCQVSGDDQRESLAAQIPAAAAAAGRMKVQNAPDGGD
jgi:hypothetical protein